MINERRKEFAATGVSKDELFDVLDIVQSKTEELVVTRDVSVELREEILKNCEEFKENIERTYTNLGEAEWLCRRYTELFLWLRLVFLRFV